MRSRPEIRRGREAILESDPPHRRAAGLRPHVGSREEAGRRARIQSRGQTEDRRWHLREHRELSHMRQRALTSNLGTLPDVAGQLAVVANRAGTGINMKVRALADGVNSMTIQLDQALKMAHEAPPEKDKDKENLQS